MRYVYLLWLILLFVLPISIIFVYSFLEPQIYGGVQWNFTLDAYRYLQSI